jgi:hypothetical protein
MSAEIASAAIEIQTVGAKRLAITVKGNEEETASMRISITNNLSPRSSQASTPK